MDLKQEISDHSDARTANKTRHAAIEISALNIMISPSYGNYNLFFTNSVYWQFALSVLNLKRIELATDEDISWRIDKWAKLFKADTWEELRMIAAEDLEMTNTAKTLYTKNQDETARLWAQAREDFLWREASIIAEAEKAQKEAAKAQEETAKFQKEAAKYRALLIANGIDPNS